MADGLAAERRVSAPVLRSRDSYAELGDDWWDESVPSEDGFGNKNLRDMDAELEPKANPTLEINFAEQDNRHFRQNHLCGEIFQVNDLDLIFPA